MKLLSAMLAFALAVPTVAHALTFPDRGRAAVVDAAHVMSPGAADALNQRVAAWDNATEHQLAVVTLPSLQGTTIADYGYQLGRAWGLGRKGIDDGVLLIIAPAEHKVRIEVGRGLEGDLTDAETSVILSGTVVPRLRGGDLNGATAAGADAIMAAVPPEAGDLANAPKRSDGHPWAIVLGILATVAAIACAAWALGRRRRLRAEAEYDEIGKRALRRPGLADHRRSRFADDPGPPPSGGSGASYEPRRSPTVISPVIINAPTYESPRRRDDDSSSSSSWGSSSSDSSSPSSSYDSGSSSSVFDSGGGSFSGGGSDSSW